MTDASPPGLSPLPAMARLDGGGSTLLLDLTHPQPAMLYFGSALPHDLDASLLAAMLSRDVPLGVLLPRPAIALTPTMANGYVGPPGLIAHHADGSGFAPNFMLTASRYDDEQLRLVSHDRDGQLELTHQFRLDSGTGVLEASSHLEAKAGSPLFVHRLAAPIIPLTDDLVRLISLSGRWAGEFQLNEAPLTTGAFVRENRRGRASHDAFPGVILTDGRAGERHGRALGLHLGASGNHFLHVERFGEGSALAMLGELLLPGEITLSPGDRYTSPTLYLAPSESGLEGVSARFQAHLRDAILPPWVKARPRPVHYNSWEAVYFDHDEGVLRDLATRAAALGVERFVLDDGWFGSRRSDRAGLGDWTVSAAVYPAGLAPLIAHAHALGMEFGIWVEPEMVNPDSDLYRAHPDWVLALPDAEPLPMRHQLVLDLTRAEVTAYLFERLDTLLRDHAIAYLKWDMNRDLNQPGDAHGRAATSRQTAAVHALIDRLRAVHPGVEIESCASGGGRANFEILRRTERLWPSDNNDALDRLAIQRGTSLFFPPEIMGSHIGPRTCHITGRHLPIELRAGVALWGHMGLEMDLRELTDAEAEVTARALALHKRFRALLHGGQPLRLERQDWDERWGVIAPDASEALFGYALTASLPTQLPGRYRFAGIDEARDYRLRSIWQTKGIAPGHLEALDDQVIPGRLLSQIGIELPYMWPQSLLIFHLERVPA